MSGDRFSISFGSQRIGQFTVPGIPDQTEAEKLQAKAARPLRSVKPQRAADFGLFDTGSRAQLDLVDHVSQQTQPKEE